MVNSKVTLARFFRLLHYPLFCLTSWLTPLDCRHEFHALIVFVAIAINVAAQAQWSRAAWAARQWRTEHEAENLWTGIEGMADPADRRACRDACH